MSDNNEKRDRDEVTALRSLVWELVAALKPFASFGQYLIDNPRSGLDEVLYSWDMNPAAEIRKADLAKAVAALARAGEMGVKS